MFDHLIVSLKRDSSLIRIVSHCLSCRKQMMENCRFCTFFSTRFLSVTPEISESRASERLPCVSSSRWWWSVWLLSLSVLVGSGPKPLRLLPNLSERLQQTRQRGPSDSRSAAGSAWYDLQVTSRFGASRENCHKRCNRFRRNTDLNREIILLHLKPSSHFWS